MKFEIKNRFTGRVQFECEIEAEISVPFGIRLGMAIKVAISRGADLRGAVLSGAVLRVADLSGAVLRVADLRVADLSGAVLNGADLSDADLRGADLRGADLSGADLRGADWIPKIENIHQKVFAAASAEGALDMGSWHQNNNFCGTTHCRAGWVTHLAGEGGRVLDAVMGTAAAAALIYQASDPALEKVPDFYCGNKVALADMKRLADLEDAR